MRKQKHSYIHTMLLFVVWSMSYVPLGLCQQFLSYGVRDMSLLVCFFEGAGAGGTKSGFILSIFFGIITFAPTFFV